MPRPVAEEIARVVFSRLQKLVAGGGTNTRASAVTRTTKNRDDWSPQHNEIVLTHTKPQPDAQHSHHGNPPVQGWSITFHIWCHVMPSELDPTPTDELLNGFDADVRLVITDPVATWHNFDNLAINAYWDTPEPSESATAIEALKIPLTVKFRTDENDLYTARV